jgi:hypothetical protein
MYERIYMFILKLHKTEKNNISIRIKKRNDIGQHYYLLFQITKTYMLVNNFEITIFLL